MKNQFSILTTLGVFILITSQCSQKTEEKPEEKKPVIKVTNPNGMSEMSLLMEEITQQLMSVRTSLLDSANSIEKLPVDTRYQDMYTSKTSKKHTIDEKFKRYASSFLASAEIFNSASHSERITEFNRMITTCKNCHQDICPGPLERIKLLDIK